MTISQKFGLGMAAFALAGGIFYYVAWQVGLTDFPGSANVLQSKAETVSAPKTPSPIPGEGMVSLNFDDGFLSIYDYALPILNAAGIKSTQYIITQSFGDDGYVTKKQVLKMAAEGHEIGAHTRGHLRLSQLSPEAARKEIEGSRDDLMKLGINPVYTFAYPYGDYDPEVERLVREAGFIGARTTKPGFNEKDTPKFLLKQKDIAPQVRFPEVKSLIDQAVQDKKWLVLVFHRIDEDAKDVSSRHELLQQIVNHLVEKQVPVVTMKEGLGLMERLP